MAQVTTTPQVHDVVVVGSGAGGGTVTKVLADLGVSVLLMEAGPMLNIVGPQGAHVAVQRAASRRGAQGRGVLGPADGLHLQRDLRRRAARGRTLHGGAGQRLLVVPLAHSRRPHQPLRPRHAAVRRLRLQAAIARRPRLRLADQLRGPRAVLRQGRDASSASSARSRSIRSAPDGIFDTPAPLRAHDTLVQRSCAKLEHPRRRRAAGGDDRRRGTAGPAATTAASAAAAA